MGVHGLAKIFIPLRLFHILTYYNYNPEVQCAFVSASLLGYVSISLSVYLMSLVCWWVSLTQAQVFCNVRTGLYQIYSPIQLLVFLILGRREAFSASQVVGFGFI